MAQQQMTPEQLQALQEKIKNMSPEELKEFQKKQCIFCQIIEGKVQSRKVYEDSIAYGALDINPANPGHILLMTKEHYTIMPQIPDDEVAHIFSVSKVLSNTILRSLEAQGTNIIVANGVAAGQRAQHFMLHIIPRKDSDGISFQLPQRSMEQQEIDTVGEKIIAALNSLPNVQNKITPEKPEMLPIPPKKAIEAQFEEKEEEKPKEIKAKRQQPKEKKAEEKNGSGIDLDDIAKLLGAR